MTVKKKKLIFWLINGLLLVLSMTALILFGYCGGRLQSQTAAERWAGESGMSFSQLSCFLPRENAVTLNEIYAFKNKAMEKIVAADLTEDENAVLLCDAWSTTGTLSVSSDKAISDAVITAVGGDFFHFHPMTLLSGSYFSDDDLMKDRVLLDRELAWKLFGGVELTGMSIEISGKTFIIAGVVDRDTDKGSKMSYPEGCGLYMAYDAYNAISETGITCYEVIMPEPIKNFAYSIVKENFTVGNGEILKNTGRYSLINSASSFASFGKRSMRTTAVGYPCWENAARYYEDWCVLLFIFFALFLIMPVVSCAVVLVKLLIKGKRVVKERAPAAAQKVAGKIEYRLFSSKSSRNGKGKR